MRIYSGGALEQIDPIGVEQYVKDNLNTSLKGTNDSQHITFSAVCH